MNLIELIKEKAIVHHSEIVDIRRHLHMYPELSFEEKQTGLYISEVLKLAGIRHETGWGGHGVLAVIKGEQEGDKTIALRADIDALPINEQNDVPYKSRNEGKMHACGHDVHTSSLLGTVLILNEIKKYFGGTIKCIFQPGEEKLPGGASLLIKEGILDSPKVKNIYGQHVHPPLEVGKVGLKGGPYMASADEIYITVIGKGGHGALPHECVDTILMASRVIEGLQSIVSRNSNPLTPSVLTLGKINSDGGATNIIPDKVFLEGTFRTMDEVWRTEAHEKIEQTVKQICGSMGGDCEVKVMKGYPSLINNPEFTAITKEWMIAYLGKENVVDLPKRMTAEDFAYYSQKVTSCFYRLGTGNQQKGITSPVHTPTFDIDEKALEVGSGLMAYLAVQALNS